MNAVHDTNDSRRAVRAAGLALMAAAMRTARAFGVLAAVAMLIGLARWPTIHWELALAYPASSGETRAAIDAMFAGLNRYLGNFMGEFLGELSLNTFFVLSAFGLLRAGRALLGYAGLVAGVLGLIASLRNVTALVAPIAEVDNYLLPVWLIVLGIVLLRWSASGPNGAISRSTLATQST